MKAEARLWVGLGCALVLALVAYGLVLSPDRRSAPGEATRELEEGRGRLAKPDLRSPEKEPGDPPSGVRPGTPAPEVSIAELEWDDLSGRDRTAQLHSSFSTALEALRAGSTSPAVIARAEGALSNLRTEMYATPGGRLAHRELEQQLEALTEERGDETSR